MAGLHRKGWRVVVVLLSGRPLVIPPATLGQMDALLAAWLPGTEGDGVADVLFGDHAPTGRLSFSWPRTMQQARCEDRQTDPLYPLGFGLDFNGNSVA